MRQCTNYHRAGPSGFASIQHSSRRPIPHCRNRQQDCRRQGLVSPAAAWDYAASNNQRQQGPSMAPQRDVEYEAPEWGPDPLGTLITMLGGAVTLMVARIADALAVVLPPYASRTAVENSVRGGLALLTLLLLDSVLSAVLTIGGALLALYVATQVLGLQLPLLGGGSPRNYEEGGAGPTYTRGAGAAGATRPASDSNSNGYSQYNQHTRPVGSAPFSGRQAAYSQAYAANRAPYSAASPYGTPSASPYAAGGAAQYSAPPAYGVPLYGAPPGRVVPGRNAPRPEGAPPPKRPQQPDVIDVGRS